MVEVSVDCCLELRLIALVIKFKKLTILLSFPAPRQLRVVILIALCIDHLDFIV